MAREASSPATDSKIRRYCHLLQVSLVYVNTLMIQKVLEEEQWKGRLTANRPARFVPAHPVQGPNTLFGFFVR
jgi:hypothetical protein